MGKLLIEKTQEINWHEKTHKPSKQWAELIPAEPIHLETPWCVRISCCYKHVSRLPLLSLSLWHAVMFFPIFMVMLCLLAGNRSLLQGVSNVTQFPCGNCKALRQGRCRHVLQGACEYSGFQSIREIKYRVWESVGRGKATVSTIKAFYTIIGLN